jgi:hypothetical protein
MQAQCTELLKLPTYSFNDMQLLDVSNTQLELFVGLTYVIVRLRSMKQKIIKLKLDEIYTRIRTVAMIINRLMFLDFYYRQDTTILRRVRC